MNELDDNKFSAEIRINEANAHHGYCRVKDCMNKIHSFHHRIPNTKFNRKKFPLLIQSQINCAGVCQEHHIGHKRVPGLDISEQEAQIYENDLQKLNNNKQEESSNG